MIQLVERNVQKVQLSDMSIEFICQFYVERYENNRDTVLMIYNQDEYFTNIASGEAFTLVTDDDLIYYLLYIAKGKSVKKDNNMQNSAKKIIENVPNISYVYVENSMDNEKALFYTDNIVDDVVKKEYVDSFLSQRNLLRNKGVRAYIIRVPRQDDFKEVMMRRSECIVGPEFKIQWIENRKEAMLKILHHFTDLGYDDAKEKMLHRGKIEMMFRGGVRAIYLVGPCIVAGSAVPGVDMAAVLYKKLMDLGLDYTVIRVISSVEDGNFRAVLEKDIKKNDIVLFITVLDKTAADVALDDIYKNYRGEKWLYTNVPIHATGTGVDLITDEIVKKIIKPVAAVSDKRYDENILHKGHRQLTYYESILIRQYVEGLKQYSHKSYDMAGACIMTCNPFTKGHYHLIEYASRQVDYLYVFVVEEDAFWVPFADRIEMVRRGTADLQNVIILPSGSMISRATFVNYFEKEIKKDVVIDAEKDIMIFRDYVAPALGISKRFVGEEPGDNITRQYNRLLKRDLANVIEVVEIPRKTTRGNEVISASRVRNYLESDEWNKVEEMVPHSTVEYLRQNKKRFYDRSNSSINKVIKFISQHDQIVICGLGEDGQKLIVQLKKKLDVKEMEKLEFYDKKADLQEYRYCDKKVIGFKELVSKYKDYYMLITTRKYRQDIFCSLIKNNISADKILVVN